MTISKEQALINISKARLHKLVAFQLYIDNGVNAKLHEEFIIAETKYYTMIEAYSDCGLVGYQDRQDLPEYKIAQS